MSALITFHDLDRARGLEDVIACAIHVFLENSRTLY